MIMLGSFPPSLGQIALTKSTRSRGADAVIPSRHVVHPGKPGRSHSVPGSSNGGQPGNAVRFFGAAFLERAEGPCELCRCFVSVTRRRRCPVSRRLRHGQNRALTTQQEKLYNSF